MALVLGTNCGFVTVAPTGNPAGNNMQADALAWAGKYTSPATATKVIEIGWYCDNATQAADTEVGIYTHNSGDDDPDILLGSAIFAKGTGAGWKKATVNITISPSTTYWLAFQLDNTANTTYGNVGSGTSRRGYSVQNSLPSPWGNFSASYDSSNLAIYAVWEAGGWSHTVLGVSSPDEFLGIAGSNIDEILGI